MEIVPHLDRMARILDRIDDPTQRSQLLHALERIALDKLADQEQEKLPGAVEPDPDTADTITGFLE